MKLRLLLSLAIAAALSSVVRADEPRALADGVVVNRESGSDLSWMPQNDKRIVDVRALRYYYFNKDTERFERELLRLRQLHPGWKPTAEILSPDLGGPDERPVWAAINSGDETRARELMTELGTKFKSYTPSSELLRVLDERALWRAYESGDDRRARELIAELTQKYKGWTPPGDLPVLLDERALWAAFEAGDTARLRELMADLAVKHKGWTPPADLLRLLDERELWATYDKGEYRKLREMIAALAVKHKGWAAPADLVQVLEAAETRQKIVEASARKDWAEVKRIVDGYGKPLSCRALDVSWAAAEAYARMKSADRALALYRTLVAECEKAADRLSTIQKASLLLEPSQINELFTAERNRPHTSDEQARLETFRNEWRFGRIATALGKGEPVTDGDRGEFEEFTKNRKSAGFAATLGWAAYQKKSDDAAIAWFKRAMEWQPTAGAAEGLALTYHRSGQTDQALALLAAWKAKAPNLAKLEEDLRRGGENKELVAAIKAQRAGDYSRCIEATGAMEKHDAGTAKIRAWCFYGLNRVHDAIEWFERSLRLPGKNQYADNLHESAAYGLTLAYLATGDQEKAIDVARKFKLDGKEKRTVLGELLMLEAERLYAAEEWRRFLKVVEYRRQFAEDRRSLQILEGWAYNTLRQKKKAYEIFLRLHKEMPSPETEKGLFETQEHSPYG